MEKSSSFPEAEPTSIAVSNVILVKHGASDCVVVHGVHCNTMVILSYSYTDDEQEIRREQS